jgi:hypothetical protein
MTLMIPPGLPPHVHTPPVLDEYIVSAEFLQILAGAVMEPGSPFTVTKAVT